MTAPPASVFRGGIGLWRSWLNRPLSQRQCAVGWLISTALFVGGTQLLGGVTSGDASDSINTAWAFAHGVPSCAYAPGNQFGLPYIAPLYSLLSSGLAVLFRIGHGVTFPTQAQMGPHCSTAISAMYHWSLRYGALRPTVELGYVGWMILVAGVVALLRASGRGRSGWEPTTLVLVALVPSVSMCLHEYFHPQDLVAMGLVLGSLASARRGEWVWTGVLLGLALATQQFALLVLAPLVVIAPQHRLIRFLGASIASFAIVTVPLVVVASPSALRAVLAGSGTTWDSGTPVSYTH